VGSEAVDWLIERRDELGLATRKDAVALGQMLIDRGVIHHVVNRQPFKDGYKFYRFYRDETSKYREITSDERRSVTMKLQNQEAEKEELMDPASLVRNMV